MTAVVGRYKFKLERNCCYTLCENPYFKVKSVSYTYARCTETEHKLNHHTEFRTTGIGDGNVSKPPEKKGEG